MRPLFEKHFIPVASVDLYEEVLETMAYGSAMLWVLHLTRA